MFIVCELGEETHCKSKQHRYGRSHSSDRTRQHGEQGLCQKAKCPNRAPGSRLGPSRRLQAVLCRELSWVPSCVVNYEASYKQMMQKADEIRSHAIGGSVERRDILRVDGIIAVSWSQPRSPGVLQQDRRYAAGVAPSLRRNINGRTMDSEIKFQIRVQLHSSMIDILEKKKTFS